MRRKISVLLASYRGQEAVKHSLDSLSSQKGVDFEVVTVAHGWKEGLQNLMTRSLQIPQKLVFLAKQEGNNGIQEACKARNEGLAFCTGDLVFFMHDNSTLEGSDYLSRLWKASQEGTRMVGTRKIVHCHASEHIPEHTLDVTGWFALQDAAPRNFLSQVKGFDEQYEGDHGYHDIDLFFRLRAAGCPYAHVVGLVSYTRNSKVFSDKWGTPGSNMFS